jgi:hypothetical protein
VFWGVLGGIVLVGAVLGARTRLRRLAPADRELGGVKAALGETPQELERRAAAAESRGAFAEAIRLRFRAGLLALGSSAVIEYRPSLRTAEVSRKLRSEDFDALARTFERVAYGGGDAAAGDVAASREGWKRVVTEAGR